MSDCCIESFIDFDNINQIFHTQICYPHCAVFLRFLYLSSTDLCESDTDSSMYSHFTLTWGNSELPKCWNETPNRGVSLSIRMTDFLSARTVWLSYCLSGKQYLAGERYPWSVGFYGLCNAPTHLLREAQTPDLTWSGAIKAAEVQDNPPPPQILLSSHRQTCGAKLTLFV